MCAVTVHDHTITSERPALKRFDRERRSRSRNRSARKNSSFPRRDPTAGERALVRAGGVMYGCSMTRVPFNIPPVTGRELDYIGEVVRRREFSGNGSFTA